MQVSPRTPFSSLQFLRGGWGGEFCIHHFLDESLSQQKYLCWCSPQPSICDASSAHLFLSCWPVYSNVPNRPRCHLGWLLLSSWMPLSQCFSSQARHTSISFLFIHITILLIELSHTKLYRLCVQSCSYVITFSRIAFSYLLLFFTPSMHLVNVV